MSHNPLSLGAPLGDPSATGDHSGHTTTAPVHEGHASTSTFGGPSDPDSLPSTSPVGHTGTAPTSSLVGPSPAAHEHITNNNGFMDESEKESPTPTLTGEAEVPLPARGKEGHGNAELGLNEKETQNERSHHHLDSRHPHDQPRKSERTATGTGTGTPATNNSATGAGGDAAQSMGMVSLTLSRQGSHPPNVGLFGGVAPGAEDAERGLPAVRSREEEDEREAVAEKAGPDPWAVKFEPGEKINPKNWGVNYRWGLTAIAGLLVLNSTFASSSPSGIITDMIEYFGFSQEVAILTISLFVAGYCVGPVLWGPLSESYGRRPIFIITFIVYTGMQVGCALSKNTGSILIFRFLGGTFAAAPLTNSGALLADIWDTDHRGQAMALFALAPFAGPSIGPIVAGFIEVSGTSWRWVFWILTIFAGFCLAVIVLIVPETYAPKILANKAKKLRKETGEQRWYAPLEKASTKWKSRTYDIVCKPFVILALEPMLMAVTLYMSFVYGVVYLLFEAYPFVFEINHGFNAGEEGLAFLGLLLGGVLCVIFFITVIEPRYLKHAAAVAPSPPKPEKRLELCVISGWSLVIAMFWFGWTSYSSIHWISPVLAGVLLGVAVLGMFVSLFNYIVDVYLWSAASALAGATVMRSAFGAAFPLFAVQMYQKLGTQWASSLLGFIALLMAPIPIVLMIFGKKLRARSKFSPNKMS